jgi:hypothetical protein
VETTVKDPVTKKVTESAALTAHKTWFTTERITPKMYGAPTAAAAK